MYSRNGEGEETKFNEFLRICYVIGTKTAGDAGAHLAEVCHKKYNKHSLIIRTAMAFAEYARGQLLEFSHGVGELDGFNSNTSRANKAVPVQDGRTIGFKHRESKEFALLPRANRTATRGHAGPEDLADVERPIAQKFKEGSIMGSDSCRAFGGALSRLRKNEGITIPHITARHGHKEYVRPCKVNLKGLSKKVRASLLSEKAKTRRKSKAELLAKATVTQAKSCRKKRAPSSKQSSRRHPATKHAKRASSTTLSSSAKNVNLLGGDNAVEGLFGAITNGMSRTNLKGRRAGENAHVNQLSTAWLLRRPGLDSVLEALKVHRVKFQDAIDPRKFHDASHWLDRAKRL
jgi:hypothetical protein